MAKSYFYQWTGCTAPVPGWNIQHMGPLKSRCSGKKFRSWGCWFVCSFLQGRAENCTLICEKSFVCRNLFRKLHSNQHPKCKCKFSFKVNCKRTISFVLKCQTLSDFLIDWFFMNNSFQNKDATRIYFSNVSKHSSHSLHHQIQVWDLIASKRQNK